MCSGMVALKALGISVETYYASEIDQEAICVSHVRHQEIRHIGDVSHINNAEVKTNFHTFILCLRTSVIIRLFCASFKAQGMGSF